MTAQPQTVMPLEEVKEAITHLRNESQRERDAQIKKRDKALSFLEKCLYDEGFKGWDEHVSILDSVLHHLEAQRKECECGQLNTLVGLGKAVKLKEGTLLSSAQPPISFCPWCGGILKS